MLEEALCTCPGALNMACHWASMAFCCRFAAIPSFKKVLLLHCSELWGVLGSRWPQLNTPRLCGPCVQCCGCAAQGPARDESSRRLGLCRVFLGSHRLWLIAGQASRKHFWQALFDICSMHPRQTGKESLLKFGLDDITEDTNLQIHDIRVTLDSMSKRYLMRMIEVWLQNLVNRDRQ